MVTGRKPFQGVANIIRFNWPFFVVSITAITTVFVFCLFINDFWKPALLIGCGLAALPILISLVVSTYIYDFSGLYNLNWINMNGPSTLVNIHAGFDETSELLQQKFPTSTLTVLDFYDPTIHTEPSIKRARNAYPAYAGTRAISTNSVPLAAESIDRIFLVFAAHEIRNEQERIDFFKELYRILTPEGEIQVMEHLRDLPNFLAYTIGFFHFHSRRTWLNTFEKSRFSIAYEKKFTPFVSTFILKKNATTH